LDASSFDDIIAAPTARRFPPPARWRWSAMEPRYREQPDEGDLGRAVTTRCRDDANGDWWRSSSAGGSERRQGDLRAAGADDPVAPARGRARDLRLFPAAPASRS